MFEKNQKVLYVTVEELRKLMIDFYRGIVKECVDDIIYHGCDSVPIPKRIFRCGIGEDEASVYDIIEIAQIWAEVYLDGNDCADVIILVHEKKYHLIGDPYLTHEEFREIVKDDA